MENLKKRLSVDVATDKEEYRPLDKATVTVQVTDVDGKPGQAEVTLWAVDYGVLSLTGYKTPDVLDSVWVDKALQVMNEDSRQNIVSRRVITPKGADEGGGGGMDDGAENKARKDFRVLAFWLGSAVTDARGRFVTEQKLPEAMTTYRIMAVVQDKASRFGAGQREIRLSKPLLMTPAFPRFLALGDKATFGAVVHSLLKDAGTAIVTMKSLTPDVLEVSGGTQSVAVPSKGSVEARFDVSTKMTGTGKLLLTASMNGEEDAFEMPLAVRVLLAPEVVAAYGTAAPEAQETVALPQGVLPSVGGLHLELSSTALVGLSEGATYLVDYPYGCAEQRASCALALMLTADLGGAFQIPGIKAEDLKGVTKKTLRELEDFQCENGGFVYWKGSPCQYASPYLTSYILHVYQRAKKLGYTVNPDVLSRACDFLEQALGVEPKPNEAYMPAYTSWQAYSVRVLAEEGRTVDSHLTRLYGYRDRMPVFALCYLWDAMRRTGEKGARPEDMERRVRNAVLPEGGSAHVEELSDPYLLWYWNSTVRSTAIALGSLVSNAAGPQSVPEMVRWLLAARKNGRWSNTQENATAMEALVDYYRKYEKDVPDFTAVVTLGLKTLATETFKGRDTQGANPGHAHGRPAPDGQAGRQAPPGLQARGDGDPLLRGAAQVRRRRHVPDGPGRGHHRQAPLRARRRRCGLDELQGRRPGPGRPRFRPHQGAPLGGRDRPHPRRLRARRVLVRHDGPRPRRRTAGDGGPGRVDGLVGARRLRPRGAPRRPRPPLRHPPGRGAPHLQLRVPGHDGRHLPDRPGPRRGDVRARGVRADGDDCRRGEAVEVSPQVR